MSYMSREDKKRNKLHCKSASFSFKFNCWFARNEEEIKTITISAITSLIVQLTIKYLL